MCADRIISNLKIFWPMEGSPQAVPVQRGSGELHAWGAAVPWVLWGSPEPDRVPPAWGQCREQIQPFPQSSSVQSSLPCIIRVQKVFSFRRINN